MATAPLSALLPTTVVTDNLESVLVETVAAARTAWPTLVVSVDRFIPHLGERLAGSPDPALLIRQLHTSDLYLACGCADGIPDALRVFEDQFVPEIELFVTRNSPSTPVDELVQSMRQKVLLARGPKRARILDYSGTGTLMSWLRVVATRTIIDFQRGEAARHRAVANAELTAEVLAIDPELVYMRLQYQHELKTAFEEAIASLTVRQRNLLRQHHVHKLSLEAIAALYNTHRATAARWLHRARLALLIRTRRSFARRVELSSSDLRSATRVIGSELELSIHRVLGESDEPEDDSNAP